MKEQRRSRRIVATVSLEIDSSGDLLPASTAVINLNGALILSAANWPPGTDLAIRNPATGREVRGRVVWSGTQDSSRLYKLGVEFHSASPEFWGDSYDLHGEEAP